MHKLIGASFLGILLMLGLSLSLLIELTTRPIQIQETLGASFDAELEATAQTAREMHDNLAIQCTDALIAGRKLGLYRTAPIAKLPPSCHEVILRTTVSITKLMQDITGYGATLGPLLK